MQFLSQNMAGHTLEDFGQFFTAGFVLVATILLPKKSLFCGVIAVHFLITIESEPPRSQLSIGLPANGMPTIAN